MPYDLYISTIDAARIGLCHMLDETELSDRAVQVAQFGFAVLYGVHKIRK